VDHSIDIIESAVAPKPTRPGWDGVLRPMSWHIRRRTASICGLSTC